MENELILKRKKEKNYIMLNDLKLPKSPLKKNPKTKNVKILKKQTKS